MKKLPPRRERGLQMLCRNGWCWGFIKELMFNVDEEMIVRMLMETMMMLMMMPKWMTLGASLGNSLCSTVESITSPPVLSHNSGAPLWGWIPPWYIGLHTIWVNCSPTCNKITFFLSAKLLSTNVLDNHGKVKPQVEWKCFSSARFVQLWHTFVLDNCAPLTLDWMVLDKLFNTGALWERNSD